MMHDERRPLTVSRRALLEAAAVGLVSLAGPGAIGAVETPADVKKGATVRDHLWLFGCRPGGDNYVLERHNIRGGSRMTPAEGAFWLGVPNLLFIRGQSDPPLPATEQGNKPWRAKSTFEQYAISFQPLERVVWSVIGSGGAGSMADLKPVITLAQAYPNISGIYLDDFIRDAQTRADGRYVGRPALTPEELKEARRRLSAVGRPMEIWVTLYTHEIGPENRRFKPGFRGCDPPLAEFLDLFDVLTLWTWNADELVALEENLAALETIAPKGARIALGMYVWDFQNGRPVPLELMKLQCETGLKWLKAGRIEGLIFLDNNVFDVGLPGADFLRAWIAEVGDRPL